MESMESTKYPWSPKKFLYILCSIPKLLEVHGVHRQFMDSIYLFVKSVDFIQSPWSPHVNPWILCIPWTPQGLPGGLKSTHKNQDKIGVNILNFSIQAACLWLRYP